MKSSQKIISTLSSLLFYLPMTSSETPIEFLDQFPKDNLQIEKSFKLDAENDYWSLFLYNSLSKQRDELVCFKIQTKRSWILRDPKGKLVNEVQINNVSKLRKDNEEHENEILKNDLPESEACFKANLKPVSISQYSMEISSMPSKYYEESKIIEGNVNELNQSKEFDFTIQSDKIQLIFDRKTGLLTKYIDLELNEEYQIEISFLTYGTKRFTSKERSGAYLFIPDSERPGSLEIKNTKLQIIKGNLISKVITFIDVGFEIKHEVILTKDDSYFDIKNEFHLSRKTFPNKELVMRLKTDVKNKNLFYSDLNGFQMAKREYYKKIPLQGNVYPMSTIAYIEDLKSRINFITGQPLAMTSSQPSNIDVFMGRISQIKSFYNYHSLLNVNFYS